MTRDARAPETELPRDKSTISTKGRHVRIDGGRAAAQPRWLRNVNEYVRRQPHEYQVMRFG
jgi:hypothetical protein